jgi:hypothetical protein
MSVRPSGDGEDWQELTSIDGVGRRARPPRWWDGFHQEAERAVHPTDSWHHLEVENPAPRARERPCHRMTVVFSRHARAHDRAEAKGARGRGFGGQSRGLGLGQDGSFWSRGPGAGVQG